MKEIKAILAAYWSVMCSIYIGYILITFGAEKEILTLIIGLISGTILGSILGTYFSSDNHKTEPTINTDTLNANNVENATANTINNEGTGTSETVTSNPE